MTEANVDQEMEVVEKKERKNSKLLDPSYLNRVQGATLRILEDSFESYGEFVATRPYLFISLCIGLTVLCGLGLCRFRAENEGIKLWIPYNSDFRTNSDWLFEHYPRDLRFNSIIFEADNVLSADSIRAMYRVSQGIRGIKNANGDTWEDMCMKRPVIKPPSVLDIFGRRKRNAEFDDDGFDFEFEDEPEPIPVDMDAATFFSIEQYPNPYCDIVENMPTACFEQSILELFGHDGKYDEVTDREMAELTDEEVLRKINRGNMSGIFLTPYNFTSLLSQVEYDEAGNIVSAKATYILFFGKMNMTAAKTNPAAGRSEPIDPRMLQFEGEMLDVLLNTSHYPEGLKSYPNVARSFGDIAGATILGDVMFFSAGYMLMFAYVTIMLGKINCIEHRAFLSMVGVLGVIMGIILSYGICSVLGLFYGPMHSVLPFLMLGIGIDDMFVIVQCWDTLTPEEKKGTLPQRFGKVMRHAGAAITVTSATDIIAFAIGGFTILPALQSFCLYAAVGIVAIFTFQSNFFLACMVIDQRRIEARRNGCCPCYVHPDAALTADNLEANRVNKPPPVSELEQPDSIMSTLFKLFAKILLLPSVRIGVLLLTLLVTGFGIWGNVLLRQEFDPTWFLPPDTYIAKWFVHNKLYFPSAGERGSIYYTEINLPADIIKIEALNNRLREQDDIVKNVDSWTTNYIKYLDQMHLTLENTTNNETLFRTTLAQFLFSPSGAFYQSKFQFSSEDNLQCGGLVPEVLMSETNYIHVLFSGPEEHVPAMNRVKHLISESGLAGRVFPMSMGYAAWETDEIISHEVYRNIALAILCVFITTLFFVSNVKGAIIILMCVVLTLIDVGGFMHFWNLTIDTVSCNNLIIAIGLCVDYSAHVIHRFLTETGSRRVRVVNSLVNIGPAVLNGGVSTFLAFIFLATSESHVFSSFFKIFFLVVTFGLFHGLVFLPVALSYIGPASMHEGSNAIEVQQNRAEDEEAANNSVPLLEKPLSSNKTRGSNECLPTASIGSAANGDSIEYIDQ